MLFQSLLLFFENVQHSVFQTVFPQSFLTQAPKQPFIGNDASHKAIQILFFPGPWAPR